MKAHTEEGWYEYGLAASAASTFAAEEFGHAQLGNTLRNRRMVAVTAAAAMKPGASANALGSNSAQREATYRILENSRVDVRRLTDAAAEACVRRCEGHQFVFAAVDHTTLNLPDPNGTRNVGKIGEPGNRASGINVVTAIGITPDGVPAGLLGQVYYNRMKFKSKPRVVARKVPFAQKETRHWLDVWQQAERALLKSGAAGFMTLWLLFDRFGDFQESLAKAESSEHFLTVRSGRKRRVFDENGQDLDTVMLDAPVRGRYGLFVPAGKVRKERNATMEIRSKVVAICLPATVDGPARTVRLGVVLASEISPVPEGEEPLRWQLITNYPVETFDDVKWVVYGYSRRWAIEEFHKTWKGTCRVEHNRLHGDNVPRWAAIQASVAMRIERIKHLARTEPEVPASTEFTREEIDTTIILREPKGYSVGDEPTMQKMVDWVAELGGYMGRTPSRGPPGSIVIARGLKQIEGGVRVLAALNQRNKSAKTRGKP